MQADQTIYQRAANAALAGLLVQFALTILVALIGLYAQSAALYAATWYILGGLVVWTILWLVYHQYQLERLESLEAEQLSQTDASAAALFEEAGDQLALARKRLNNLLSYGLNTASVILGSYLLLLGGTLLFLNYRTLMSSDAVVQVLSGTRFLEDIAITGEFAWLDGLGIQPRASIGIVLIVTVSLAFICFLLARYVAGMTRQEHWRLLRGGAGYLMGSAALLGLCAVASLGTMLNYPLIFGVVALLIPLFMALLGLEILLAFVFSLYRPRRAGEVPTPAFDSRLTGWLSSPEALGRIVSETLNYQFGFEISSSWFYRLLGRVFGPLLVFGVVVLVSLTSLVIVNPQQQAVITRFGQFQSVVEPGLHLKWPWPIGQARKYEVYRIHQLTVGSDMEGIMPGAAILWTNQHAKTHEEYLVTAPTPLPPGERLAADIPAAGLAGGHLIVQYRVSDLNQYVRAAVNPRQMISDLAMREMNLFFITHDIDRLLTGDRYHAATMLQENIQKQVDIMDMGVEITFAGLTALHPPQDQEVAANFHQTINAEQEKQSMIEEARRNANQILAEVAGSSAQALGIARAVDELQPLQEELTLLQAHYGTDQWGPDKQQRMQMLESQLNEGQVALQAMLDEVGGEAVSLIHQARAIRWQTAVRAQAQAASFQARLHAYRAAPVYYRNRLYLEALSEGLRDQRKIIMATDSPTPPTLRVDMKQMERTLGLIGIDSN